jgi:hypothetical protein
LQYTIEVMATASQINEADGGSIDNSRDQTTQDFLTGLKERENLKLDLNEREKELVAVKSQNYDLIKKIESLEKEVRCTQLSLFPPFGA